MKSLSIRFLFSYHSPSVYKWFALRPILVETTETGGYVTSDEMCTCVYMCVIPMLLFHLVIHLTYPLFTGR